MALGGVFAAVAVVIMALGGMIPAATFVCPMLCMLLLRYIATKCEISVSWAWYAAVAILSLLLSPDKEAAAVFAFLGYYPLIKPKMDGLPLKLLWKLLYFNAVILLMYGLLMHVFGMAQILQEFEEMGTVMTLITLLLGNVCFWMLDVLLGKKLKRR